MLIKQYKISKDFSTSIYFGVCYRNFETIINNNKIFIICDSNLYEIYKDFLKNFENLFIIIPNENYKNFNTVFNILNAFEKNNVDKDYIVIAFGGGMVSDITGFAASIYRRGISFGFIPTSLIAQIDAAYGGKNGINFNNLKNYIGVFNQPEFILIDPTLLQTLPQPEFISGIGELIKYAIISDADFFDLIFDNAEKILTKNAQILEFIIKKCSEFKMDIVCKDPLDKSLRNILNFGHSFGHIYELKHSLPHGIAVAQGIFTATELALFLDICSLNTAKRIFELLNIYGFYNKNLYSPDIINDLIKDKKSSSASYKFVLPKEIGKMEIVTLKKNEIEDFLKN